MKQSVKGWQLIVATLAIVILLVVLGMKAFGPSSGKLSEAIPAGPTPVVEGH